MTCERRTASEEETQSLGRKLGEALEPGDLIGLTGPLGVGKTSLVRGIAEGLRVPRNRVRSPSFILVATYRGGRLPLYHIDLFRMQPTPVDRLALREYMYGDGACVIEWFERFGEPAEHLEIEMTYEASHARRIRLRAGGERYRRLIEAVNR